MNKAFFKLLLTLILIANPSILAPAVTYAQTTTSTKAAATEQRVTRLKTKADTEITRRVTSLTTLSTKISGSSRLSDTDKTTLTTEIQSEITNLNSLKTKIDADTDITTLKTDVQTIVSEYRIYALELPKLAIINASDSMLTRIDTFESLATKLQTRIQDAQSAGKDVTSMQAAYTDMQSKLNDAKSQANNAKTQVISLTAAGYPGNKSTLVAARNTSLKTGRQDLAAARQDFVTIIQGLKGSSSTQATGSASAQ